MNEISGILNFLWEQKNESDIQCLFERKGYLDTRSDDFGLNLWTSRLAPQKVFSGGQEKVQEPVLPSKHIVSFLSIPLKRKDELHDTNSFELRNWVMKYAWLQIFGINAPFSSEQIKACSEGLLLYRPDYETEKGLLESFLLLQGDGEIEFGLGKEAYSNRHEDEIFLFIQIMSRFTQFLAFSNDFYGKFYPENSQEIIYSINLRNTENTLLGNLAEGWNDPHNSTNPYRPICRDKHLQVQRRITPRISDIEKENIIRLFATRIDNAWDQFEPRCYVEEKIDPARPFARRSK